MRTLEVIAVVAVLWPIAAVALASAIGAVVRAGSHDVGAGATASPASGARGLTAR
jgi:hypothetical protein